MFAISMVLYKLKEMLFFVSKETSNNKKKLSIFFLNSRVLTKWVKTLNRNSNCIKIKHSTGLHFLNNKF